MKDVIVLNADYSFINKISWQKAVSLIYKGKAEATALTDKTIYNYDKSYSIIIPKIIRLIKMIRELFKARVPYSKRNIFIRDGFRCSYCGDLLDIKECTIDHIIPQAKGGKTTWENCITSCKGCNNKKGDMLLRETGMRLLKTPHHPSIHEFYLEYVKFHGIDKIIKEAIS